MSNSSLCFSEPGGVIQTKKGFNKQTIQIKGYFSVFCNYCTDEISVLVSNTYFVFNVCSFDFTNFFIVVFYFFVWTKTTNIF